MTDDCQDQLVAYLGTFADHIKDEANQKMTEDHTVVICEEVLKRREILLDMSNTRETEINRKRAEAWDEVHMATVNRCQRNLRLEQIKRVWRHQKNRVRHILNLEKQGLDGDVTLEDIIASRKGFMTDYEIDIARAYLEIPPRCRSPGSRRLDELDLTFRKRAATAASIRIDDSVSSVLDRIAAECATEAQNRSSSETKRSTFDNVKIETPQDQGCNSGLNVQAFLDAMGQASSNQDASGCKREHVDSDDSSCLSGNVTPMKRKRASRRKTTLLIDEQYEMIKAQRIAFEEQAQMFRSMRTFIEESTRTLLDLSGRIVRDQTSTVESSPSESNLEFAGPSNLPQL